MPSFGARPHPLGRTSRCRNQRTRGEGENGSNWWEIRAGHALSRSGKNGRASKDGSPRLRSVAASNGRRAASRHAVCWWKASYGTNRSRGRRFIERMTVNVSCKAQERSILTFFLDAIAAARTGARSLHSSPSLVERLPSFPHVEILLFIVDSF
ncbi:Mobile element protein [Fimbriiglobus ruber]|uniref:Mobile element protein n=1 Tax=Fimbriiglobus ruber TaxID=1908690 RepID=A0A225D5P4_9BACT|nr:Mobile element protein [Fimbriiglobus ruber]